MVKSTPCSGDGSGVGQHAQAATDFSQVTTRNVCWGLVADTELKACRAPVDKLDGAFGLDNANGSIDVLRNNITTVEECTSHLTTNEQV